MVKAWVLFDLKTFCSKPHQRILFYALRHYKESSMGCMGSGRTPCEVATILMLFLCVSFFSYRSSCLQNPAFGRIKGRAARTCWWAWSSEIPSNLMRNAMIREGDLLLPAEQNTSELPLWFWWIRSATLSKCWSRGAWGWSSTGTQMQSTPRYSGQGYSAQVFTTRVMPLWDSADWFRASTPLRYREGVTWEIILVTAEDIHTDKMWLYYILHV